jgi:hypothetical protein
VEQRLERVTAAKEIKALVSDPVRFGMLFELVFVNLVVTAPGVHVAFKLERYRLPTYLEVERTIAVGRWHVLATLSAVIAFFLVLDRLRVQGLVRQLAGWGALVGSTVAFVFVQFYMFHRPGKSRGWAVPFLDAGVGLLLLALAASLSAALAKLSDGQRERR